jgi:hypothetical protein
MLRASVSVTLVSVLFIPEYSVSGFGGFGQFMTPILGTKENRGKLVTALFRAICHLPNHPSSHHHLLGHPPCILCGVVFCILSVCSVNP